MMFHYDDTVLPYPTLFFSGLFPFRSYYQRKTDHQNWSEQTMQLAVEKVCAK